MNRVEKAGTGFLATLFAPSDEQAMWRVQTADDAEAFAQLVGRWQEPIFRLCGRMTGDAGRAGACANRRHSVTAIERRFRETCSTLGVMKHLNDEERLAIIEGRANSEAAERLKACAECAAEVDAWRRSTRKLETFDWPAQ